MKTLKAAACVSLVAAAALSATGITQLLDQCDWIPVEAPLLAILATLPPLWLATGKLLQRPLRRIRRP